MAVSMLSMSVRCLLSLGPHFRTLVDPAFGLSDLVLDGAREGVVVRVERRDVVDEEVQDGVDSVVALAVAVARALLNLGHLGRLEKAFQQVDVSGSKA